MPIVAGLDIGVRNLAYCVTEQRAPEAGAAQPRLRVSAWATVDLQAGGIASGAARRCGCGKPAAWTDQSGAVTTLWCRACCKGSAKRQPAAPKPVLPCAAGVTPLRALAQREGGWGLFEVAAVAEKKTTKTKTRAAAVPKEALLAAAAQRYLLPFKPGKATREPLGDIATAIDAWLDSALPAFAVADLIRLENQPALTGPTMKSVQMMVFSLLHHRLRRELGWKGAITFVHAAEKTKGAPVAPTAVPEATAVVTAVPEATTTTAAAAKSAAKRVRKEQAIALVSGSVASPDVQVPEDLRELWRSARKKDDLADAFLMAARPFSA